MNLKYAAGVEILPFKVKSSCASIRDVNQFIVIFVINFKAMGSIAFDVIRSSTYRIIDYQSKNLELCVATTSPLDDFTGHYAQYVTPVGLWILKAGRD